MNNEEIIKATRIFFLFIIIVFLIRSIDVILNYREIKKYQKVITHGIQTEINGPYNVAGTNDAQFIIVIKDYYKNN